MPTPRSKHGSHKNVYAGIETRTNKYAKNSKSHHYTQKLMAPATITLRGKPGKMFPKGFLVRLGDWMYEVPENTFIPTTGSIDILCAAKRPAK